VLAVASRAFKEPPEVMELEAPTPGPGEILVRMSAAGLNPFDWKILDGFFDGHRPHRFPLVVGVDGAGWVEALGPGVTRFEVTDSIFGSFLHTPVGTGTVAQYTTVPESNAVLRFPAEMAASEAAALPTAGMTAVDAIDWLQIPSGGRLVIVGAAGGVGSFAVQVARAAGLHVTAVARPGSDARLRDLGVDEIVDYTRPDLVHRLTSLHPDGVDGLLDMVNPKEQFAAMQAIVRKGGRAATTRFVADPASGASLGIEVKDVNMQPSTALLGRLLDLVQRRDLTIPIEHTIRLDEVPRALALSRAGSASGKTVVLISD
jgi:NADPH:quinone reductase-like Zn-dependent oxidoreductase